MVGGPSGLGNKPVVVQQPQNTTGTSSTSVTPPASNASPPPAASPTFGPKTTASAGAVTNAANPKNDFTSGASAPRGNVVVIPGGPPQGDSKLIPLGTSMKIGQSIGNDGSGLKAPAWTTVKASDLPAAAQKNLQPNSIVYKLAGSFPGASGDIYAVRTPPGPDNTNGDWIGVFDQQGTMAGHVETQDDAGWTDMVHFGNETPSPAPATPAPQMNVIKIPGGAPHGVSNLIPLGASLKIGQSIGNDGSGLKAPAWTTVKASDLPAAAAKQNLQPNSIVYKFAGDASAFPGASGDIFAVRTPPGPSNTNGDWIGVFDKQGTMVGHVETKDDAGWTDMVDFGGQ